MVLNNYSTFRLDGFSLGSLEICRGDLVHEKQWLWPDQANVNIIAIVIAFFFALVFLIEAESCKFSPENRKIKVHSIVSFCLLFRKMCTSCSHLNDNVFLRILSLSFLFLWWFVHTSLYFSASVLRVSTISSKNFFNGRISLSRSSTSAAIFFCGFSKYNRAHKSC